MKKELKTKMIAYLKWRVKHNNLEITYIQIAKYLEIDNRKAEDILKTMVESDFVNQYIQFRCIKCKEVQYIKKENVLYCLNCGQQYSIKDFPIKRQNIYIINREKMFCLRSDRKTGLKVVGEKMKKKVFLSYAHEDEKYKLELDKHLAVQKRNEVIDTWNDRKLVAGSEIDEEIKEELNSADIIILILSADFFASAYCYDKEMKRAIERHRCGEARIIPVIARKCDWLDSPLGKITALPIDGKSIASFADKDDAYMQIVLGIKEAIKELG